MDRVGYEGAARIQTGRNTAFWGMDRTSALTALMSLGYNDFINWEDASCNFDSQEFIDVLDFANMFPEEFEYRDDMEDSTVLLSQENSF